MRRVISVPTAPVPAGPYSHAVRAGDFIYVSGQVPRLVDGTYEPTDVETETRLTSWVPAVVATPDLRRCDVSTEKSCRARGGAAAPLVSSEISPSAPG